MKNTIIFQWYYCDNFKCVFDFANFIQCKQNTLEAYEMLKDYIVYIHVKDAIWDTGKIVVPGVGDGNLKKILRRILKSGTTFG